uniref:Ig-like domain-containing protein n=1 Tax=Cyprinus carpio TaxID=7962 RepID=A0A8C1QLG0_CYPCA
MFSRMFSLFSLISLIMIPVICSQDWQVQYSNYSGRVQYFPDKEQTFFLKLSNVTHEDEGMYCLRILTNVEKQRYLGFPGIDLKVTELRVEIPEEVVEGESSVLVCKTTCNLSDKTNFTWYKNSKSLSESIDSDQLLLQSVSSDDSGNYSCAVRDQKHLPSPAVTLSVRYPPKSVSVSISPSGEIVEGDSVTLSCSSDSNPPALNFSWFKENQSSAVGSGQSFIISSFNSSHSGRYYCEARNQHGSQRSASVSVSVKGVWNILYIIAVCVTSAITVGCGLLFLIIIIVQKRIKKINNDSKDTEQKKTSAGKASESRDAENASAQDDRDTDTKKPEEEEIAYASITFHHSANEAKSAASQEMDVSVIYSSIR